ncbi:MAG TPA: GIY-YIG nuclease family protein [Lacunisphaera sp.]
MSGSHSTRWPSQLAHGLRPAYTNLVNALIAEARRMALSKGQRPASKGACVVYFLRLRSGALYIGASEDLEQRLDDHISGQACRTTKLDAPIAFLRFEVFGSFAEARTREAQLKRWTRAKKEALVKDDIERLHALSRSRESEN